jgi:hypothetical protein
VRAEAEIAAGLGRERHLINSPLLSRARFSEHMRGRERVERFVESRVNRYELAKLLNGA